MELQNVDLTVALWMPQCPRNILFHTKAFRAGDIAEKGWQPPGTFEGDEINTIFYNIQDT